MSDKCRFCCRSSLKRIEVGDSSLPIVGFDIPDLSARSSCGIGLGRLAKFLVGLLEPDNRPNVVEGQNSRLRNMQHLEEDTWISPRFSSLLFSLCCLAAAVGTAVDAGTDRC